MKGFTYLAAAAIAVSGVCFIGCKDDTDRNKAPTTQSASDKAGAAAKDAGNAMKEGAGAVGDAVAGLGAKVAGEIGVGRAVDAGIARELIKSATNAAVTDGGLDDLVERLSKGDRDRIGTKDIEQRDLDTMLDQMGKDWKAKYGENMKIHDNDVLEKALPDSVLKVEARDKNVTSNTIALGASHGMGELAIPVMRDDPAGWKIDAADSITDSAKLRDAVTKHLKEMSDKSKWPDDKADAYGALAHHVMMALQDK